MPWIKLGPEEKAVAYCSIHFPFGSGGDGADGDTGSFVGLASTLFQPFHTAIQARHPLQEVWSK